MINSIVLHNLKNGEFLRFLKNFNAFVEEVGPDALNVSKEFMALKAMLVEASALFNNSTGSAITAELEALDKQRDNALSGVRFLIQGFSHSTDAMVKQRGQILLAHLQSFGTEIIDDSYQSETETIDSMVTDWSTKPELIDAIVGLNLSTWKDELARANTNFDDNYKKRSKSTGMADAKFLKAKRVELNTAYYKLRDRLNAMEIISDGAELNVNLSKAINGLVQDYNETLARRGGNGGDDTSTPNTPAT